MFQKSFLSLKLPVTSSISLKNQFRYKNEGPKKGPFIKTFYLRKPSSEMSLL